MTLFQKFPIARSERWGADELASTGGIYGGTIDMKRQQEH
jgi:hypothetical protein